MRKIKARKNKYKKKNKQKNKKNKQNKKKIENIKRIVEKSGGMLGQFLFLRIL